VFFGHWIVANVNKRGGLRLVGNDSAANQMAYRSIMPSTLVAGAATHPSSSHDCYPTLIRGIARACKSIRRVTAILRATCRSYYVHWHHIILCACDTLIYDDDCSGTQFCRMPLTKYDFINHHHNIIIITCHDDNRYVYYTYREFLDCIKSTYVKMTSTKSKLDYLYVILL
jgi:hypothetical protein